VREVRPNVGKIIEGAAAKGVTIHRPRAAELAAWRAVGEKSAVAVMATLPPEAAKLRDELIAAVKSAPR
jgi:hypothetical protein